MSSPPKPRVGALFSDVYSGSGGVSRGLFTSGGDVARETIAIHPVNPDPSDPVVPVPGDPVTSNCGRATVQWYRDGVAISGATSHTYTLTTDDMGHDITVRCGGSVGVDSGPISVPVFTAPGAPGTPVATAGLGYPASQATVVFATGTTGGASGTIAFTGFTVISSPAGGVDFWAGTRDGLVNNTVTRIITGLTNGTAYTFTATESNIVGTSAESGASNSVTPVSVPDAPVIGTATKEVGGATVTYTAPANDGGSTIIGYTAYPTPFTATSFSVGAALSILFGDWNQSRLMDGWSYTFEVVATNAVGTSARSAASNSITVPTVPDAPTIGTATGGNAQASVTFSAPASDGGDTITGYTATSTPGGFTGTGATSPITVTGLTNGTAYTFTVTATNGVGTGSPSAASNSVTPAVVYGTWNPSDKSTRITLSGSNLTATGDGTANFQLVRETLFKSSGKLYCEFSAAWSANQFIGVANASESVNNYLGVTTNGYGFSPGAGQLYNNGAFGAYGSAGSTMSMLLDLDANTLTFWKNGVTLGTAFSGLSGSFAVAASVYTDGGGVTVNLGSAAWSYSPPAGYEGWS